MKLIAAPVSPYSRKVRIVLAEKRIDYEMVVDNPGDPATRVPEFNPLGKLFDKLSKRAPFKDTAPPDS